MFLEILSNRGRAVEFLERLGADVTLLRALLDTPPVPRNPSGRGIPLCDGAKRVIEFAFEEARALAHNYIGEEHLLLGLLREEQSIAARVLRDQGIQLDDVRRLTA